MQMFQHTWLGIGEEFGNRALTLISSWLRLMDYKVLAKSPLFDSITALVVHLIYCFLAFSPLLTTCLLARLGHEQILVVASASGPPLSSAELTKMMFQASAGWEHMAQVHDPAQQPSWINAGAARLSCEQFETRTQVLYNTSS